MTKFLLGLLGVKSPTNRYYEFKAYRVGLNIRESVRKAAKWLVRS